ncbi:MBL fold metallo-hydrolase [Roseovarius salinarum]|uniref:MBL fold metallo-hydrolase n=1 Tax=Roseovarius salinarum TaxID=1981892 RepID=UPI000C332EE2|nr:MBL fold metallo-hydrolase [Roseovarius salinarum]
MTHPVSLGRRALLGGAAALPLTAALPGLLNAAAPMQGPATTRFKRFRLGAFEVTTLLAASRTVPDPHGIFGQNVSDEAFAEASRAARIPTDRAQFFFTPTVVNTGAELILFDTGLNADGITGALGAAGYDPGQVDTVVITHMHPDHIGGLMKGGAPTFPNARYATGRVEYDAWAGMDSDGFDAKVRPLADRMAMLEDGDSVTGGINAMAAFGHTPGHMTFMLESEGRQMLIAADFANHYVWSLAHPDWQVKFDMDDEKAAATRRRLLDMLASEGMPFVGYHMPWPGTGYVERNGAGYAYTPTSYQLMLDG